MAMGIRVWVINTILHFPVAAVHINTSSAEARFELKRVVSVRALF